jgi:ureidoacrylate peracid hydrolase
LADEVNKMNVTGMLSAGKKAAVVVIDMQNDYVHEDGKISKFGLGIGCVKATLPKIEGFLEAMRGKNIEIIHTQMCEDSSLIAKNLLTKKQETYGEPENWSLAKPGTWGYQLAIKPWDNEKIFPKNNYDIFSNAQLEAYLKERGIDTLIFVGGYTHACVDTSVRSAVTRGFNAIVAKDLVSSPDRLQSLHEHALIVLDLLFASCADSGFIRECLQ